jgi:hypothetical protein
LQATKNGLRIASYCKPLRGAGHCKPLIALQAIACLAANASYCYASCCKLLQAIAAIAGYCVASYCISNYCKPLPLLSVIALQAIAVAASFCVAGYCKPL